MKASVYVCVTLGLMLGVAGSAQTNPPRSDPQADPQPIYRVTVVSRTLQAVNYEHRGGPTRIDFQGTVLLPKAKGEAIVESKRGRVSVDAKLEHLEAPTKFGREYLTYVLWAITPEGRPKNLGELLVDDSNKAHIAVTTDMQAFGLLVTAEPYYSVTMPSDVVVMENVVRPDTIGTREEITAKYELLPRGGYTMNIQPNQLQTVAGEKLPYDRYETILEVYQAQNAVQIAQSLGADHYAPESFTKAESLLAQAQNLQARHADTHTIISAAREATQMAEDARVITTKRRDEERQLRDRQQQSQDQSRAIENAQAAAQQAQAQAAAAEASAEAERAAAARARHEAEQAQIMATERAAQAEAYRERLSANRATSQVPVTGQPTRGELIAQLNTVLITRDTPRGLVVTVPNVSFEPNRNVLGLTGSAQLARLGTMLARHPGLSVKVEGYMDDRGSDREDQNISEQRAQAVRQVLIANGVPPQWVIAIGYGKSRPMVSNETASGREQNRRVEIVISGPSIGAQALWDRTYSLK